MGALFELKHLNLMTYLTTRGAVPPRVRRSELLEFLRALAHGRDGPPPFISSSSEWIGKMQDLAHEACRSTHNLNDELISADDTTRVLAILKEALVSYDFFACAVGSSALNDPAAEIALKLAVRSEGHALFLIPLGAEKRDYLTVLDPLPAFVPALENRSNWPGLLFWSPSGQAVFAPAQVAEDLAEKLLSASQRSSFEIDEILREYRSQKTGLKLLHLSDLHYGRPEAAENEALLLAEIESNIDTVHRTVITGDLFDNPKRADQVLFRNFRASLTRRSGKEPIVIPGNHDQRWLGIVGQNSREVADLEWSSLVIDDESKCVFFCFDSSKDADGARGKVSIQQLRDVGTAFATAAVKRRQIRSYLPIALVHHHPISFKVAEETLVQRFLSKVGWNVSDPRTPSFGSRRPMPWAPAWARAVTPPGW